MLQHPDIRTLMLASARKEFVDYFMENTKDMPDTNFDGQVARFLLASAAARRFMEESSERGRSRRDKRRRTQLALFLRLLGRVQVT